MVGRLLVIGGTGQIGQAIVKLALSENIETLSFGSLQANILDKVVLFQLLAAHKPAFVLNAAGFTGIDEAEKISDKCFAINMQGAANLAEACKRHNVPLIHLSSDYIFDGQKESPYNESDQANPLNEYGRSKWEGEEAIRAILPSHIILRTGWAYGATGRNFVKTLIRLAKENRRLKVGDEQKGCPTSTAEIARCVVAMIKQISCVMDTQHNLWGTYHFCGAEATTWHKFASVVLTEASKFDDIRLDSLDSLDSEEVEMLARRPLNTVLECRKIFYHFGIKQRPWRTELIKVIREMYWHG